MDDLCPAPEKGDTLFVADLDFQRNAHISEFNKDFYNYAKGYKDAADHIVQGVNSGLRHFNFQLDALVFPVVFLYRQYLELRMKEIIIASNRLNGKATDYERLSHHKFGALWPKVRPMIEAVATNISASELDAVESCINEFIKLDPKGTAFRYPIDRTGKWQPPELPVINVGHLRETMQKLGNFFDGYSEYFVVLWQDAQSLENDY